MQPNNGKMGVARNTESVKVKTKFESVEIFVHSGPGWMLSWQYRAVRMVLHNLFVVVASVIITLSNFHKSVAKPQECC